MFSNFEIYLQSLHVNERELYLELFMLTIEVTFGCVESNFQSQFQSHQFGQSFSISFDIQSKSSSHTDLVSHSITFQKLSLLFTLNS
ncbi:MAG: hypothetical protein Q8S84_07815 [bacterium]|nr:hypothetical protein [bacterium]MDP3381345.1 hypothetical protein [bacterium]